MSRPMRVALAIAVTLAWMTPAHTQQSGSAEPPSVTIRVVGVDGEPAAGCLVSVFPGNLEGLHPGWSYPPRSFARPGGEPLWRGVTNEDGVVSIARDHVERGTLVCERGTEAAAMEGFWFRSATLEGHSIGLIPMIRCTVEVRDEEGAPLPGAIVFLLDPDQPPQRGDMGHGPRQDATWGVSDANGQLVCYYAKNARFGRPVRVRTKRLAALGMRAGGDPAIVVERIDSDTPTLTLVYPPTVALDLHLTDGGEPIAGSVTWLRTEGLSEFAMQQPTGALRSAVYWTLRQWFLPVPAEGRRVCAFAPRTRTWLVDNSRLDASFWTEVELTDELERTITLERKWRTPSSVPPSGARVRLVEPDGSPADPRGLAAYLGETAAADTRPISFRWERYDERGVVDIALPPGPARKIAIGEVPRPPFLPEDQIAAVVVEVPEIPESGFVELPDVVVARSPLLAEGVVIDRDGAPVPRAQVVLIARDSASPDEEEARLDGRSDADGRFSFRGSLVEGLEYSLTTKGSWNSDETSIEPGTRDLAFRVRREPTLAARIRAVNPEWNDLLSVALTATELDEKADARLDPDGTLRVGDPIGRRPVAPGTYRLDVSLAGVPAFTLDGIELNENEITAPAELRDLRVGESFSEHLVRVRDPEGEPIVGAEVRLLLPGEKAFTLFTMRKREARTDFDGEAWLVVPPMEGLRVRVEPWRSRVLAADRRCRDATVDVTEFPLEVVLEPED